MMRASPAHEPAGEARAAVECALDGLPALGGGPQVRAVGVHLQRAVAHLFTVLDTPPELPAHDSAVDQAAAEVAEAAKLAVGAPATLSALERARVALERAAHALAEAHIRRQIVTSPVRAPDGFDVPFEVSRGVPRLHTVRHDPLVPELELPSIEPSAAQTAEVAAPPPETLNELRVFAAEAESGQLARRVQEKLAQATAVQAGAQPPSAIQLDRVVRDCLEEVAGLSTLRTPSPLETWVDQEPFEARLLANLDAFVSFGAVGLPCVTLFHAESAVPDVGRGFVVAFGLGCLRGTDSVATAVATLKQSPPEEYPGFIDGFVLASSPAIDSELVGLLEQADPGLQGVAVEVLGARGSLPDAAVPGLVTRADGLLQARVARALGRSTSREIAIPWLQELLGRSPGDELFLACIESLLRRGHGAGRDLLRSVLATPAATVRHDGAGWLLALSGRREDHELLTAQLRVAPTPRLVRGLGRFGHVDALPLLIGLLQCGDEPVVEAAAEALERITAAGLYEELQVPWGDGEPPKASFLPTPSMPTRTVRVVVRDANRWKGWWSATANRLDARFKHRAGRPFTVDQIVEELAAHGTRPAERAEAALEMSLALGEDHGFSTADWVARQRDVLARLLVEAQRAKLPPGAWCFSGAGSAPTR
jgi:hypothetical protein